MIPFSIRFVMFSSFFNLGLLDCDHIALCDDSQSDTLVAKTATEAMKKATGFMTSQVAVHGGYVFSKNLSRLAVFVTAAKTAGKNVNKVP